MSAQKQIASKAELDNAGKELDEITRNFRRAIREGNSAEADELMKQSDAAMERACRALYDSGTANGLRRQSKADATHLKVK